MTRARLIFILQCLLCLGWTAKVCNCFSALSPPPQGRNAQDLSDFASNFHSEDMPLSNGNSQTKFQTAILLNTNARSVSTELVPIAESIFGKDYVFVTTSEEEGRQAAAKMVQQNISMVIPVGGDGTLASLVNFLCDSIREKNPSVTTVEDAMKELPLIGYVPLGTGNGVGSVVGSATLSDPAWKILGQKKRKLRQVRNMLHNFHRIGQQLNTNPNYLATEQSPDVIELPMMQVSYPGSKLHKDTLCFFAGAGFDSLMLQDFQSIKKWAIRTKILTKALSSVAGYCVALSSRHFPNA